MFELNLPCLVRQQMYFCKFNCFRIFFGGAVAVVAAKAAKQQDDKVI